MEDPQLDRLALGLGPSDTVLAITSGGCNVLPYVLTEPARVYAVDVNPRQNALLELKLAAIKTLDFQNFFSIFGEGRLPGFPTLCRSVLRPLSLGRGAPALGQVSALIFRLRVAAFFLLLRHRRHLRRPG